MNMFNHMAVGAGIALVADEPLLALPLAFVSHFALDALPHYGVQGDEGYKSLFKHRRTLAMALIDIVGITVLVALCWGQDWYVFAAMLFAISPDFIWLQRYFLYERFNRKPPKPGPITRFHQRIQWCERMWGIWIEIPLAGILLYKITEMV